MVSSLLIFLAIKGYVEPWGKDSALAKKPIPKVVLKESEGFFGKTLENIILFHQEVLSPIDGPRSHFRPTSSRYTLLSIRRFGPLKGWLKGMDRLMRENSDPWVYRTILIDDIEYKWDPSYETPP
ncbi:membrane protein insertion efficiency factor YidD [bacterium]|jgi:putative component of membrane protein insertase Oxa1/YidC/SpoIIIJ protein YidD|nr:membrane protein insertion efficiency factor YidD [Chlamydiota bacterium]NDD99803.1 membrane protein insertion efficiency factor YidD [bacterium]